MVALAMFGFSKFLRRAGLLLVLLCSVNGAPAYAQGGLSELKVAFLYNFLNYAELPTVPDHYQICLVGDHGLSADTAALTRREISGRSIEVRTLVRGEAGLGCHLLFIAASEAARAAQIVSMFNRRPVLTVADFPVDATVPLMIGLQVVDERLRFSINQTLARSAGITISSRMLRLALNVY